MVNRILITENNLTLKVQDDGYKIVFSIQGTDISWKIEGDDYWKFKNSIHSEVPTYDELIDARNTRHKLLELKEGVVSC